MKYIILLTISILLYSCGSSGDNTGAKSAEVESVVEQRYGISTRGYELRTNEVKVGETMGSLMRSYGHSIADIDRVDRASRDIFPLRNIRAGSRYTLFLRVDSLGENHLDYLVYEKDPLNYILFVMLDDSISTIAGKRSSTLSRQRCVAEIESSLLNAIVDHNMPYSLGVELEDIFRWSIDLFRLRKGDNITVLYEERFVDDSISVGVERVLGVKFYHRGENHYAIPFDDGRGEEYWNEEGQSLRMQLLKSPMRYSRIGAQHSSPSLKHSDDGAVGLIYAAPTGTAIYSVGDGVVSLVGEDRVVVRHAGGLESSYHNLGRFARGIARGVRVEQGELLGHVGSPEQGSNSSYIEYRVIVDGATVDPLTIPRRSLKSISEDNRATFDVVSGSVVEELNGGLQ